MYPWLARILGLVSVGWTLRGRKEKSKAKVIPREDAGMPRPWSFEELWLLMAMVLGMMALAVLHTADIHVDPETMRSLDILIVAGWVIVTVMLRQKFSQVVNR